MPQVPIFTSLDALLDHWGVQPEPADATGSAVDMTDEQMQMALKLSTTISLTLRDQSAEDATNILATAAALYMAANCCREPQPETAAVFLGDQFLDVFGEDLFRLTGSNDPSKS